MGRRREWRQPSPGTVGNAQESRARRGAIPICGARIRATTRSACRSSGRRSSASARAHGRGIRSEGQRQRGADRQGPESGARERVLCRGSVRDQRVAPLARTARRAVARDVARRRSAERPVARADAGRPTAARRAARAARSRACRRRTPTSRTTIAASRAGSSARSFPSSTATARRSCRRPASS